MMSPHVTRSLVILTIWTCVFAIVLSRSAQAQSTTGTISGHVSDAQGLAVPGVTVVAASANL